MASKSHSLPYSGLIKKLLQKEGLYDASKDEIELGRELDITVAQKMRHSEPVEEAAPLESGTQEGNSSVLLRIANTLDQIARDQAVLARGQEKLTQVLTRLCDALFPQSP